MLVFTLEHSIPPLPVKEVLNWYWKWCCLKTVGWPVQGSMTFKRVHDKDKFFEMYFFKHFLFMFDSYDFEKCPIK